MLYFGISVHICENFQNDCLPAITVFVCRKIILFTAPYAPRPISPKSCKSSDVKSYSTPGGICNFPAACIRIRSLQTHNNPKLN